MFNVYKEIKKVCYKLLNKEEFIDYLKGTKENIKKLKWLHKLAKENKWEVLEFQYRNRMMSFIKNRIRINIYYTTNTISICIPGKRQKYLRKIMDYGDVFKNINNYI
jgi:hypothetical protein